MGLVLLAIVPSGDPQIVQLRSELSDLIPSPKHTCTVPMSPPILRHVDSEFHACPSPFLYIGTGCSDIQGRPSQWCNPYIFLELDPLHGLALFKRYSQFRADLEDCLSPLGGSVLVCDCDRGAACHGFTPIETVNDVCVAEVSEDLEAAQLDAMSVACVVEGFDDDAEEEGIAAAAEDEDVAPPPKFNAATEAVNETIRSNAPNVHQERPSWLPSWIMLISIIRGALIPVFWEMFAGKAGLTCEHLRQGWPCGPPVDIVYHPDFDLLHPLFLSVALCLIFERCVRVLHLGPPCSSFSMACNRFKRYAMRSAMKPDGL